MHRAAGCSAPSPGVRPGDPPRPHRFALPAAPAAAPAATEVHPVAVRRRGEETQVLVGLDGPGPLEQWRLDHRAPHGLVHQDTLFSDEIHTAACALGDDDWIVGTERGAVTCWPAGSPGTFPLSVARGVAVTALVCHPRHPEAAIWIGYQDGVVSRPLRPKQAGQEPTTVQRLRTESLPQARGAPRSRLVVEGPRSQEVWDFACSKPLHVIDHPASPVPWRSARSPDGSLTVEWDERGLRLPDQRLVERRDIRHAAISNDGIVVIALDGKLEMHSLDQLEPVGTIVAPGLITHVAVSPLGDDQRAVVTACSEDQFHVWRIGRAVPVLESFPYRYDAGDEEVRVGASAIVHDPFGRRFLIAINDVPGKRWLRIYGLRDGTLKQQWPGVLAHPGLVIEADPSYGYRVRIAVVDQNRQLCRLVFDTRKPSFFRPAVEPERKILFLRLSTRGQVPLAQEKEYQLIEKALRAASSPFQIVGADVELGAGRFGARLVDLLKTHRPWALHVSGHATAEGLQPGVTESVDLQPRGGFASAADEAGEAPRRPGSQVEPLQLLELLARADALRCLRLVVLNVCEGGAVAKILADNVPFAIGTRGALLDPTACGYAEVFYRHFSGQEQDIVNAHEATLSSLRVDRGGAPFHLFQRR